MRVAIVKSDGYLDNRISRILASNNINGDVITKVIRSTFNEYDAIVFTYQNHIPNLPKVIEQIVLEKRLQVFYITNTLSVGQFYNLFDDLFFDYMKEETMEILLPRLLKNSKKFIKKIQILEADNKHLSEELLLIKNTNKAKRILIKKGFNEADAHRFIIDKSMSMRLPKKLVVNLIIENKIDF
jgi:hypothetical protein